MSSLMIWDGSHSHDEKDKEKEKDETGATHAQGDLSASDLTHGSNVGSSLMDNNNNGSHTTPTRASDSTLNGALSPSRVTKRSYSSTYSSHISFGSAYFVKAPATGGESSTQDGPQVHVQATVPQGGNSSSVPQTSASRASDSAAEDAVVANDDLHQSPVARSPPRTRRSSIHGLDTLTLSDAVSKGLASSGSSLQVRQQSPPSSYPSPSRTPLGHMEVDEDDEGLPVGSEDMLPYPATRTEGSAKDVEMAMAVDDDMSDLQYPSHDTTPNGPSHTVDADVRMQQPVQTPQPSHPTSKLPASRPLLSLNGKPNVLPDTPSPTSNEALARPTSPTLGIFDSADRPSPSLSPAPPARKKEPLFLSSPTPSDEQSPATPSQPPTQSHAQAQRQSHSDSPKPTWPLFDPDRVYPQPKRTPSVEVEVVEDVAPRSKGKGKAKEDVKGKGKEKAPIKVKKPTIGGIRPGSGAGPSSSSAAPVVEEEEVLRVGPPRKKKVARRRIESSVESEEDEDEGEQRMERTVAKKPQISGPSTSAARDNRKGKAPATSTATMARVKVLAAKSKGKSKAGPKSRIAQDGTISLTDSSSSSDKDAPTYRKPAASTHRNQAAPIRRKPARAQESKEEDDSDEPAPVQHRRKPHKRPPPADSEEDENSDAPIQPARRRPLKRPAPSDTEDDDEYVPARSKPQDSDSDSDIQVVKPEPEIERFPLPAGFMQRKVEVLVPRMPKDLRVMIKRAKAQQASSSTTAAPSSSAAHTATSSKSKPRPIVHKPATSHKPAVSHKAADADHSVASSSRPRPMENTTERSLADDLNAAMAANAHVESDSSDSGDDVLLVYLHKPKAKVSGAAREDKGKTREDAGKGGFVGPYKAKRPDLGAGASSSAPPIVAKKPRISSLAPTAMPPPASTSRMPPPPLPLSASIPSHGRRTKAGALNDPPCNACAAAGIFECANAPPPNHRRCLRCHERKQRCSFAPGRGRRSGSVALSRAGSVARARESSVAYGRESSVARGREGSAARGRASSVVSSRMGSVAPQTQSSKKRPHDGVESASKKRKTLIVEEAFSAPGRLGSKPRKGSTPTNAVAGSSMSANAGNAHVGPSKLRERQGSTISLTDSAGAEDPRFMDNEDDFDGDDYEIDYELPSGAVPIILTGSLQRPPEGSPQNPARARSILKYLNATKGEGQHWTHDKDPEIVEGVLDVKYGDEEDRRDRGGGGGGRRSVGGEGNGSGDRSGGSAGKGKGRNREDQVRKDTSGKGKGRQHADGRQQDSSSTRKPKARPKPRAIAPKPSPAVSTPVSRPGPFVTSHANFKDAFYPPVIPLTSASASGYTEAQHLLAALDIYNSHHSCHASAVSTPALPAPTPTIATPSRPYSYWDAAEAQHPPSGLTFEPAAEDEHADEQTAFWIHRSPVAHRDYHSESAASPSIGESAFAIAFAPSEATFPTSTVMAASPPDSEREVSDALRRDGEGSTGSSETAQTDGRSQTIDPSVLGGAIPYFSTTEEEESPVKSSQSSEIDSEPEPEPVVHGPPSDDDDDDDDAPDQMRYGPPKRRQSAREPKPTPKSRKISTPPRSESEGAEVVGLPADPTKDFKSGSRRIQWPKGTEKRFCHQCRRMTNRRHMLCTSSKAGPRRDRQCRKAFCEGCLVSRYGDAFLGLNYDSGKAFLCPSCRRFCNCTNCTEKRGEAYVGVRRNDVEGIKSVKKSRRIAKSANYGPKSVVSKRKLAEQHDSSASPTPRPAVKRIRLILPDPPKTPSPPEPWVAPKMDYEWPVGVKTELFASDGYPCGYMWMNEEGQCVTTYTREIILPGIDADGELYWSEGDVQSSSASSSSDEDDEDSAYEEPPVSRRPPPRPKRVRRVRVYAAARPLPPPVVKRLWFPHSRKFKFSADGPDLLTQSGSYVGQRPPKVKEGPLSQEVIDFLENYPFSDMEDEADADQEDGPPVEDAHPGLDDPAPEAAATANATAGPDETQSPVDEDDEDIPNLPTPPRSSSPPGIHAPAPVAAPTAPIASMLAAHLELSSPTDAATSSGLLNVAPQAQPLVGEEETLVSPSASSTLAGIDVLDGKDHVSQPDKEEYDVWPNEYVNSVIQAATSPLPGKIDGPKELEKLLGRYGSSTPSSTASITS